MKRTIAHLMYAALALLILVAGVSPRSAHASKVFYLNFDAPGVSKVTDLTGNGHAGTLVGDAVTTSGGKFGGGVQLSGTGYVTIDNAGSIIMGGNPYSVIYWFKTTTTAVSGLFAKDNDGVHANGDKYMGINRTAGKLTGDQYGVATFGPGTCPVVNDGNWHMVALTQAVVSGSNDLLTLYVDGVSVATYNAKMDRVEPGTFTMSFGRASTNAFISNLVGMMDDFSYYDETLDATQVLNIFNTTPGTQVNAVAPKAWSLFD